MKKQFKAIIAAAISALLVLSLAACSASGGIQAPAEEKEYSADIAYEKSDSYLSYSSRAEADYADDEYKLIEKDSEDLDIEVPEDFADEKLIYNVSMSIQTKDFKGALSVLNQKLKACGGFIQYEKQTDNASGWYYDYYEKTRGTLTEYIVVRIPTEKLNSFLDDISGLGKVLSRDMDVKNVTSSYNDVETRIAVLEKKEQSYIEMMGQAKSIDEMLSIDKYLTDVQEELACLKNQISNWDTDVAYSTVTLTISEVLDYTTTEQDSFWTRLVETLRESGEFFLDALEFLLNALIYILPFAVVIGGIIILCVVGAKKKKAKKAAKAQANATIDVIAQTPEKPLE